LPLFFPAGEGGIVGAFAGDIDRPRSPGTAAGVFGVYARMFEPVCFNPSTGGERFVPAALRSDSGVIVEALFFPGVAPIGILDGTPPVDDPVEGGIVILAFRTGDVVGGGGAVVGARGFPGLVVPGGCVLADFFEAGGSVAAGFEAPERFFGASPIEGSSAAALNRPSISSRMSRATSGSDISTGC
jgi:hypothetical protein